MKTLGTTAGRTTKCQRAATLARAGAGCRRALGVGPRRHGVTAVTVTSHAAKLLCALRYAALRHQCGSTTAKHGLARPASPTHRHLLVGQRHRTQQRSQPPLPALPLPPPTLLICIARRSLFLLPDRCSFRSLKVRFWRRRKGCYEDRSNTLRLGCGRRFACGTPPSRRLVRWKGGTRQPVARSSEGQLLNEALVFVDLSGRARQPSVKGRRRMGHALQCARRARRVRRAAGHSPGG